jgi:endonuclease I
MHLKLNHIRLLLLVVWAVSVHLAFAQGTYYNGIDTSKSTFVTDLHNLIYTHTRITYDNYDETNILNFASYDTTGGQRAVVCVYTGYIYVYTPPFDWTVFSREHTWCQSWMPSRNASGFTSRPEYSDQFHIFPVHQNNANGRRSNHPLGKVQTITYSFLDGKLGTDSLGNIVYEPRDAQKGDAARALMYMAVCYNGKDGYDWTFHYLNTVTLPESLSEAPEDPNLLIQWSKQDPPDDWEKARNEYVYSIQGNRNPFIDHPYYVDLIDFNTLTKKGTDTTSGGSDSTSDTTHLVIYEVYGGGGNSGSTYTNDYIVLYNPTSSSVSVAGWSVQYASATGSTWSVTPLSGSLQPDGFYLVQEAQGSGGTTSLPTPDAIGTITMAFDAGKVALCTSTTSLIGTNPSSSAIVDFVGYGTTANAYEGSGPATAPSNTVAISRKNHGQDTNDNATDFATSSPHPENSANALPVELTSFRATANRLSAELNWSTATETNNFGFEIERKTSTADWSKIGFVAGAGTSTSLHNYKYSDNVGRAGLFEYRIKQIDKSGAFKYSSTMQVEVGSAPKVLSLGSNYPNPFNPTTSIEFSVPTDGKAILKVHNMLGQEVATLFDGVATAGRLMKATFDASRFPSGVYFSRLETGGHALVKRMLLLK